MRRHCVAFVCLVGVCWCVAVGWMAVSSNSAVAQDKKGKTTAKKKTGAATVLDVEANAIQTEFIKSAEGLASKYYDLKEYDKARSLLKSIQALDPDLPGLGDKLKLLDEDMINANEAELELNVSKNEWEPTGVVVAAGKPIRIKAGGSYKFVVTSQLGPNGYAANKSASPLDLANDLPVGALIGFVTPSDRTTGGNQQDDKKRDRPFLIGEGCDYTPQKDGVLSIRINAPPDNKNNGKLKILITGGVRVLKL